MFRKVNFRVTLVAALIGAIVFSIPVGFFILYGSYTGSWLLYLGSFLFFAVMWIHNMYENKKRAKIEKTTTLVFIAHLTAILGIAISCLLSFILLVIFVPGFLTASPEKVLINEPVQMLGGRTQGLSFEIFIAATFINFSVGSFAGIIVPFYVKKSQRREAPSMS